MSTHAPSFLAAALGQVRYRLGVTVIGFGVFVGGLLVCILPLCIYGSFFDTGGALSETFRWVITGGIFSVAVGLTYLSRGWIIRKALEETPPEPVTSGHVVNAGRATTYLLVSGAAGLVALLITAIVLAIGLILAGLLGYGGYILLTMISMPVAIVIGAIIIALAVLVAAFR